MNHCPYHDAGSFPSFRSVRHKQPASLSFYHLNTCCLKNKEDDVSIFLSSLSNEFDAMAFSETWLASIDSVVQFEGYRCEAVY